MAVLFHQNMRVFGGAAPLRNAAYNNVPGAFNTIQGGLANPPIYVAGFTEIMNNGASAGTLAASCATLGVAGVGGNIPCGRTALAAGPEYIYIGTHAGCVVQTVGQILLNATSNSLTLVHQRAPGFGMLGLPGTATPDYRGLVYVVVSLPPPNAAVSIAVGFMHNLYTFEDQRVLVAGKIPEMLYLMGQAASGLLAVPVNQRYIGGDFNVRPLTPRGTTRTGRAYGYSQGLAAVPVGATAGGTTWSGSLYDYWYTDIDPGVAPGAPFVPPVPATHVQTLNAGPGIAGTMSDHCGVSLRIL